MKKYIVIALIALFCSCKSKAVLTEGTADEALATNKIINKHYANKKEFSTVYIKASARYRDANQSQSVTAEIKIKKDEQILVSIRFLGITMAKALITPTEVKYYEKINSEYFEGDYTTLSQWLGTDLDFMKVQNMLIGQAMDNLKTGNYKSTIDDKWYKLSTSDGSTTKNFYFESQKFLIKKQEIIQQSKDRKLTVDYPAHTQHAQAILPTEILLEAIQKKGKTNISIDYNTVTFNEDFSFPYSVPDGYERIFID